MARIKSPGTTIFIVGMILLAGVVWLLLMDYFPGDVKRQSSMPDSSYSYYRYVAPVDTFNEINEFIIFSKETTKTVSCKCYTQKGLLKLQSALSYLADRVDSINDIIKKNLDTLDRSVAVIDTASQNYFEELKPALAAAVKALNSIQTLNYPKLKEDISALEITNNGLLRRKSLVVQLNKIKQFFNEAAVTLQQMN